MVLLTATPSVVSHFSSLSPVTLSTVLAEQDDCPTAPGQPVSHRSLIHLAQHLRTSTATSTKHGPVTLDALLKGTTLFKPPPRPKPEQTPEYKALMARLRAEQEQKDYVRMVQQAKGTNGLAETADDEDEDHLSPTLVLNILLSVVMCAVAVFSLTRWWPNDGVRVLFSLATALVVGVAEVGVYSIYVSKLSAAKAKERNKREKKEFLGVYAGLSEESVDATGAKVVTDSKEIWGKGKHGGMRRRVREKWEKEHGNS